MGLNDDAYAPCLDKWKIVMSLSSSWFDAAMNASDSASKIFIRRVRDGETCVLYHSYKFLLGWKPLDAFNKVLVAVTIASNNLS